MLRCLQCGKDLGEDEDKYVVNWGWCDECWEDNIDADHLMTLLDFEGYFEPKTKDNSSRNRIPGPPSIKVARLIMIIEKRLGRK